MKICYGRGNVLVRKCPVGEVSFGEMSSRGIVRSGKCPSGRCPSRKCQSGICPRGSVSRGSVRSGNCPTISVSMLFLTKYESNLIVHGFCPPPITMRWLNLKICQNLVVTKSFLTFVGGVKNIWGIMFITVLLHFHYFISSLGNVNASVVICQYPKIYNFSFRKFFWEILCKSIYLGF